MVNNCDADDDDIDYDENYDEHQDDHELVLVAVASSFSCMLPALFMVAGNPSW